MFYKITLKGRLDFGTSKTYDMMFKQIRQRAEVMYKNDTVLKSDEFFFEESASMVFRFFLNVTERSWRNTVALLQNAAEFAVDGRVDAWIATMAPENKLVRHFIIEPSSDKTTVMAFKKGRDFLNQSGKESEALVAINEAIERYERHARAYELRAWVSMHMGKQKDAFNDFTKSLDIVPTAEAYIGRAHMSIAKGELKSAITDLTMAHENAVPLQSTYWTAKRVKAECYMKLNDWEGVVNELRFVAKRTFVQTDPNFPYRKRVWEIYGQALIQLGRKDEAKLAVKEAKNIDREEAAFNNIFRRLMHDIHKESLLN